jgi:hypothetical protein
MQEVILERKELAVIRLDDINCAEQDIFVYRSKGTADTVCILKRLEKYGNKFGFVPINAVGQTVRYESSSIYESIKKVLQSGRKVFRFTNNEKFYKALSTDLIKPE